MSSCLICGCVKNCEEYLDKVFDNIANISKLFKKIKIIISFDLSEDFTLLKLINLKSTLEIDMDIIINKDQLSRIRTVNIERARNKIINKIYNEYSDYEYFIMIDMDDVSAKPINIEVLKEALDKNTFWDGLFFNNENYYDFWALNFKDFQYSCWHSNDVKKLINIMNNEFKKECINKEFIECQSAFGGFGIYKTEKFKNCFYSSLIDLSLFNIKNIKNIYNDYKISYNINSEIYDCEHRYFHLNAIKNNKVRLMIYNKNLFPKYVGEHTNILN
jgi:hypothetical protein